MAELFHLDRSLIRLSGPDAVSFLQNLLTQNMEMLEAPRYAALLSPQGKVVTDLIAWPHADGIILDASLERGADLVRRLLAYKLRARVEIGDASERAAILWSVETFAGARADPRFPDGALGYRKLASKSDIDSLANGADVFDVRRLGAGIPDLARDAQAEEVFAGEALLEELHGVDFQKGCFVGQENVSRMKRRATTRKKFCPIVFEGPPPAHGTPILAGEAEIGSVRTGRHQRAMALVRLDRAADADEKGLALKADGRPVRLDPPGWLIFPSREDA